ncbi:MAG TPA: FlgD immunoglobulin-like domain containing protein, partial [bacterium]
NEIIFPIFEPQPEGINIGNPSFAQTNDAFFVFDLIDLNQDKNEIWAVDLFSGIQSMIADNGSSLGYPRYSPDDSRIVFEQEDLPGAPAIRQIPIAANRIEAAGPSVSFVGEAQRPTWFAIGSRPTGVEEAPAVIPAEFALRQNYPNPFNPETTIRYELPVAAQVSLKIFDIKGRLVAELESGSKAAGAYLAHWNGRNLASQPVASGIYFYQLEARSREGAATRLVERMTVLK